jgi:uncharacterized protein (TIGR02246 family)
MSSRNPLWVVAAAALLVMAWAFAGPLRWSGLSPARAQSAAKGAGQAGPQPAGADPRPQDRAAVRAAMQSFVKAFQSRDPKALAAHWTAGGELRTVAGAAVQGRGALEKGFTAFFAKTPEVTAEVRPESLQFLSKDAAAEEGAVTVRRGPAEPATHAHYRALFIREDGRWLLAELHESPGDRASIGDLGWLVGEWRSTSGQGAEIRTTYSWAPNQKFLQVRFTMKEKDLTLSGTQVIGVDPATGAIHTWTFEADGGVGEADWGRDGDHWILDAAGTLTDGRTLKETNILRRVNEDTFTWQSIDRTLGDTALPDLPPVKVTRVRPGA